MPKSDSVVLAGVVSWGKDCADIAPSVFARVSSFSSWIQGIVGNVTDPDPSNIPPTVYLSNPTNGQQFDQGDSIEITAVTIKVLGDGGIDTGCTGVDEWSVSQVYARSGENVGYKGNQYKNKWWTQGEQPDQSGQWGVWQLVGGCE